MIDLKLPQIFGLPSKSNSFDEKTEKDIYHYRNFLKFEVYDQKKKENMMQTMAKYKAYKKDKEEKGGFGVGPVETPEERE